MGHPERAVSEVRRADATSWKYGLCAGVALRFQVSEYSVDPAPSNRVFNLLSNDDWRAALRDERKPRRPQVASVSSAFARTCRGERLTGSAACPNRSSVGPTGETQCERPSADACEEMALLVAVKIGGANLEDAALVDKTSSDLAVVDEVSKPLRSIRIILVVEVHDEDSVTTALPIGVA